MKLPTITALLGEFYGFPSCCIDKFELNWCQATKDAYPQYPSIPNQAAPWYGTGYVPCLACARKASVNWPKFVAEQIVPRRICKVPFPDGDALGSAYIDKLLKGSYAPQSK